MPTFQKRSDPYRLVYAVRSSGLLDRPPTSFLATRLPSWGDLEQCDRFHSELIAKCAPHSIAFNPEHSE